MARGSIFKKNDRWAFRVDAGISSETGKRRQMLRQGFKTKREAETALAAAQQSVEQGSVVSKSAMKVDAFLDQWLASQQGLWGVPKMVSWLVMRRFGIRG